MRGLRDPLLSTPPSSLLSAAASLRDVPAPWTLEPFRSCDGEWSLVIMTPRADGATYVVTETPSGLSLSELRDDELRSLGEHLSLDALLLIIGNHIRPCGVADRAA